MRIKGIAVLLLLTSVCAWGCAVGRFIAGAPPVSAPNTKNALPMRRCTGCHEVPDPGAMTAREWSAALVRMQRRMRLPAAEWDSLAALRGPDASSGAR